MCRGAGRERMEGQRNERDDMNSSETASLPRTRKLGFGLMRLPKKGDAIDVPQVCGMVDRFLGAGFNYFDTAWAYPGSEEAIRKALVERHPRKSFLLASKNAAWLGCKTPEEATAQLDVSLERSGAGHLDFYLLHNLGDARTRVFEDFRLWEWALAQKAAGRIRHVGFSFHASAEQLEGVLAAHPEAEFVQLQINYADWESPSIQSRRCLEVARAHGKPVIVMEPVKGGLLANPPPDVGEVLRAAEPEASAASWALRFAADLPGVYTVLSGMSSMEQMEDNLATMGVFGGLSAGQRETIRRAQEALGRHPVVPCTGCDYCAKVCPASVGISGTFAALNIFTLYGDRRAAGTRLAWDVDGQGRKRASACLQCGACEGVCPQHIGIRGELKKAAEAFP